MFERWKLKKLLTFARFNSHTDIIEGILIVNRNFVNGVKWRKQLRMIWKQYKQLSKRGLK